MSKCKVCKKNHSKYFMNNRLVCMECDELLFDLEIECDEEMHTKEKSVATPLRLTATSQPNTKK